METVDIKVTGRKNWEMPWEEVIVMPVGDCQVGANGSATRELRQFIERGIETGAYFLGMGDYIDIMSPSNRRGWRSAAFYESVLQGMESAAEESLEKFLSLVKGTEGRWLGILEGHHYYEFADGSTSDTRIAKALEAPFLGTCAFVRLTFKKGMKQTRRAYTLWCHHGAGGGVLPHSPLNRLYHIMHSFEADCYLIGHQTKKPAVKVPCLYMARVAPYLIRWREKILAGTGGFFEGYEHRSRDIGGRPRGGYVERAMLSPVSIGGITLRLRPKREARRGAGDTVTIETIVEV